MPRPVLVIHEVDQLARRARWRACDLAEALGVSLSMLNRLRAGTHVPSREVLGAILRSFGEHPRVRELVLHYLEHELALVHAGRLDAAPAPVRGAMDDLHDFPANTRQELRAFVSHFLRRSLTSGRGLHVIAEDAQALRRVVAYARMALEEQGIGSVVLTGNAAVTASLRAAALAAPLLVVERVEFASEAVRVLLDERAAVRKPALVTSARDVGTGEPDGASATLQRICIPSPSLHAAA